MFKRITLFLIAGMIPVISEAATVTATATASSTAAAESVNDIDTGVFDTTENPSGHVLANAVAPDDIGTANSNAIFQNNALELKSAAWAERTSSATPSKHRSTSTISMSETFRAEGSGLVTLSYRLAGRVVSLTDLDDPADFAAVTGNYTVEAPGTTFGSSFRSSDEPDPLFLSDDGWFETVFSSSFEIMDGDTFYFVAQLGARAGASVTDGPGVEFFRANALIESFLSFETEGVTLIPDDGTIPAPVPLPASVLFLSSLIAGLGALRCVPKRRASCSSVPPHLLGQQLCIGKSDSAKMKPASDATGFRANPAEKTTY